MVHFTFLQLSNIGLVAFILFVLIVFINWFGHRIRQYLLAKRADESKIELGAINSVLLGLLGLLLAFTFSMANSRYDRRREIIIEEANDIGTAILRADLYPDSIRQQLRKNFKAYVEARIDYSAYGTDFDAVVKSVQESDSLGKVLWAIASDDARSNNVIVRSGQMIPALNAMIDITTTRRSAGESTIPDSIMYFLFILSICAAFLAGYDNKGSLDWIMVLGFAAILSITVYNILDLDRARNGFINMDVPNKKIIELRSYFDNP